MQSNQRKERFHCGRDPLVFVPDDDGIHHEFESSRRQGDQFFAGELPVYNDFRQAGDTHSQSGALFDRLHAGEFHDRSWPDV